MPSLTLNLLGGFEMSRHTVDGPALPTRKSRALLAYLALRRRRGHGREELAALLWEDSGERQARHSLSQALSSIRKVLTDGAQDALCIDGDRIGLAASAVETDVFQFERLVAEGSADSLARAVDMYRGDLLSGVDPQTAAFDEWLVGERARLRELALNAFGKLLTKYSKAGNTERGIDVAIRLLILDSLQENVHRALMRLYAEEGRRDAALRQYRSCREVLDRELGVEPELKTERLYREIEEHRGREGGDMSPVPSLPDKPSIVVLPFKNLSGDPEQGYFSDGITDDIITELSRFRSLFVIASNTSFKYRDLPVDVKQVGRRLGVRYVLEGSVRKVKDRLRVTVQLVSAVDGGHLWAERYDRNPEDIFDVQDDVTRTIVATLAGRVEADGIDRARRKTTENMTAYDYLLRGLDVYRRRQGRGSVQRAIAMFDKAISIDREFARAYGWHACASSQDWFDDAVDQKLDRSFEYARKGLQLDDTECECHRILGAILLYRKRYDRAEHHFERACALNPNHADIAAQTAHYLSHAGRADDALETVDRAMRLNPHHPQWYWGERALALYTARCYADAIASFRRASPDGCVDLPYAAACYAHHGDVAGAQAYAAHILRVQPNFTVATHGDWVPFKHRADLDHHLDGLRKAGLPE